MSGIKQNANPIKGPNDLETRLHFHWWYILCYHRNISKNTTSNYTIYTTDNYDFESLCVCTWTFLMIWMLVLMFYLANVRCFPDFRFLVSGGILMIIMLGNRHGSTISGNNILILCKYPQWVCKALLVLDSYFNICSV